jgi:hypothetical protein
MIKLFLKEITHTGGFNNLDVVGNLTIGKIYEGVLTPTITDPITLKPLAPSYTVRCNDNRFRKVDASFFLTIEELRENKLIELGI